MRLAWATDIHLNFLTSIDRRRFLESVKGQADALVVTGDLAESNSLGEVLRQMDSVSDMPIYFVLGNHDFYRGSVVDTRADVEEMIRNSGNLVYLSQPVAQDGPVGHPCGVDPVGIDANNLAEIIEDGSGEGHNEALLGGLPIQAAEADHLIGAAASAVEGEHNRRWLLGIVFGPDMDEIGPLPAVNLHGAGVVAGGEGIGSAQSQRNQQDQVHSASPQYLPPLPAAGLTAGNRTSPRASVPPALPDWAPRLK